MKVIWYTVLLMKIHKWFGHDIYRFENLNTFCMTCHNSRVKRMTQRKYGEKNENVECFAKNNVHKTFAGRAR